jgi:PKD repeat protein
MYANTGNALSQTFTITVNATDAAGLTGSKTAPVVVNDRPPVVMVNSPTPNPALTLATVTVTFTATDPDGTIASITVMWGDGTSSLLIGNPTSATHAYANTGNALSQVFTISVTATDNSGSISAPATTTETVIDQPPVAVIAGPSTAPVLTPVTFDGSGSADPDGTVVAWSWNFGDSTTGSGAVVTHTYAIQGTFTVTLTVTDNSGNTGTTTHAITIVQNITGHASFDGYGAKAQFKRLVLHAIPTQNLTANVINDNTTIVTVYVQFVIVDGNGVNIPILFTQVVSLVPGQTVDGTINSTFVAGFNPTSPGTFTVTATLFFSTTQSTTIGDPSFMVSATKTFSFTAVK